MNLRRHTRFAAVAGAFLLATAGAFAALLGVAPGAPSTTFGLPGSMAYDASTHVFTMTATPLYESFGTSSPLITSPRGLTINIQVDNTGALIGGTGGNDLTLTGVIANPPYSGVLLTGEVVQFGYQNVSTTDVYDFRFRVTGGALAPLYGTNDIGVRLSSEKSTFTGSFTSSFSGQAKGIIGPIPPLNTGQIGDFVWQDLNRDGLQTPGEPGIDGVTIQLLDAGGNVVQTTTTGVGPGGEHGYYQFTGLTAGTYTVAVVAASLPSGFTPTTSLVGSDTSIDSNGSPASVTLQTNTSSDQTIDFGYVAPCTGSIGDFVWNDQDRDGIQDVGEAGIPNVMIWLKSPATGNVIQTTTTDANGMYAFTGLCPGTFVVEVSPATVPNGMTPSPSNQGGDDALDSDGSPVTVTLGEGEHNTTIDFGYYPPATGRIGDVVWNDTDRDGIQDAGETGINGVTVQLFAADCLTELATQVTHTGPLGQTGYYEFTGLTAGTYCVGVLASSVPAGFVASPTLVGADRAIDSNTSPTQVVLPTNSSEDMTIDFGYNQPATGKIGDYVWHDLNRDGLQNDGNTGLDGVTVNLKDAATNVILQTTTTNSNGYYLFQGLTAGSYKVEVVPPAGFAASPTDQGGDDATDSDANGVVVTLPTDTSEDLTIDFGYNTPCSGMIGDRVWDDLDRDGVQDAGEPGLVGITVELVNPTDNTVLQTTTTGIDGIYTFNGICAGTYEVRVVTSTLSPGYTASPSLQGGDTTKDSNGSPATVTLPTDSSQDLTIDFGYNTPCSGTIGDYVWLDTDMDGVQDADEYGIDGVTLYLYDSSHVRIASQITHDGGQYLFTGVCGGDYTVEVEPATLPPGSIASPSLQGGDTTMDSNGSPASVHLASDSSHDATIDFGYYGQAASIDIVKYTNGDDADAPTGPIVPVGSTVTWTYVVTNTGNVALTNVTVTDDHGVAVTCPQTALAVGESMTCTGTGIAAAGQYGNVGTVTGTPPYGPPVTDSNPSHYFGSAPSIDIVKYTNGVDADLPPGPEIVAGAAVLWTYVVTNTGNVPLTNVTVTDDRGVTVTCPQNTLAVAATMTCSATGVAILGQYANIGSVTGTPPVGAPVTDTNPSHYFGRPATTSLGVVKSASPTTAAPFQPVTYTYTVTNTGETTLTNVVVRDDNGTTDMTSDDFVVGTIASLAPGASQTFSRTVIPPVSTQTIVNGTTYPAGKIVATPLPNGDLQITYVQDFGINDNTYGTGAVGWPSGHTFGNLTGSDKLEFRIYDKDGNVVLDFYQDYISATTVSPTYPSGYASLCASGGDGSMVSGSVTNIVSCTTSLADNLNNPLNLANKVSLIVNSPTSLVGDTVVVNTTTAPGGWDYINRYTAVIKGSTFGPEGVANFGYVTVPDQHNSPSKLGTNSIPTTPTDSTVTNTVTAFVDANTNQLWDTGELKATSTATVAIVAQPSSLSGYVYLDAANDGSRAGDTGIAGVTVTLTGTNISGPVTITTTTDATGFYQFDTLLAGTYTITEAQPGMPYLDGIDTLGSAGGTLGPDSFTGIVLAANANGTEYNFGERQAGTIAGAVYVDADNDGVKDAGETGLSGVTVRLFSGTTLVQTATTNAAGTYLFSGMAPGTYTIVETQPTAYLDGRDTAGTGLTTPGTATNDIFSGVGLVATEAGSGYNFGEVAPNTAATSTVSKVFTKTALTPGETLWFSSAFRASGLSTVGQGDVTIRMVNSYITITPKGGSPYTIPAPNATVVFKNTLPGGATTTFDAATNTWITTILKGTSNDWFLNALPYQVPATPTLTEATFSWTGTFVTDTTGVDVSSWKAAAAEYNVPTPAPAGYNAVGVKPTDNATPLYPNTDQAGVPENWKASFVANTGTGGSTQPGAYTANGNPTTQVLSGPADPTETFQTTPVIYP